VSFDVGHHFLNEEYIGSCSVDISEEGLTYYDFSQGDQTLPSEFYYHPYIHAIVEGYKSSKFNAHRWFWFDER
jgi:hypothetical protein